jgi:hypothetical protein
MVSKFSPVSLSDQDIFEDDDPLESSYSYELDKASRVALEAALETEKSDAQLRQQDRQKYTSLGSSNRKKYACQLDNVSFLPEVTKLLYKRGFQDKRILTHWADIVGEKLATCTQPIALVHRKGGEGTLRIKVTSVAALEIHHKQQIIIDKVNTYFGKKYIVRLSLEQAPVVNSGYKKKFIQEDPIPSEHLSLYLDIKTQGIKDQALRDTLKRLGASVLRNKDVAHLLDEWDYPPSP